MRTVFAAGAAGMTTSTSTEAAAARGRGEQIPDPFRSSGLPVEVYFYTPEIRNFFPEGFIYQRMWKTQSKILIDRGVFELEDAPLLLAYCNAFHLMLEAEKMLASGLTSESEMGGLKKHPAVNVRNDSVSQLARLGSLLGLDPLSRLRMTSGQKDPDDDGNEFDEFD